MNPGCAGNHAPYGAELAQRSGVHTVMVPEIETGKKGDTLKRLAEAPEVMVDDLV